MSEAGQFEYAIAVIGMAGRFPGARNVEEFWENICGGRESISFFSDEELIARGVDARLLGASEYVKAEAVLDDVELFDAAFFGLTPREAETTDPQHRLFLEHAWEALESAGYDAGNYAGRIGVYAGESVNSYLLHNLYRRRQLIEKIGASQILIGNDRDYLATFVSYKLNLKGAALSVQTACSTSLVAVHLAGQSLLNHECDMALAGGASVSNPHGHGAVYSEGGIISPDGHCRAFDARAQGTVKGSGVGVVVLKRLVDALNDGDTIHAVIKGTAINNDGALKVGYTAPSVEGQASVIEEALAVAAVEPETIGYIEAHGTGTVLGDPVEIAALTQAFRRDTDKKRFCAIGSVKTNIGHLDAAAGIAGFIKTVQTIKHGQLPPSLHFEQENPNIDFDGSPFFVNTKFSAWRAGDAPRRAGVSSFGIGGTNAHVILEEPPAASPSGASRPLQLLTLSARTPTALETATANLAAHFKRNPSLNLADAAYTLGLGRREFEHRRILVCRDLAEAVHALETPVEPKVQTCFQERASRPVVFMFSGQGAQHVGMAREIYEIEPLFREQFDACAEILRTQLDCDLRGAIYPHDDGNTDADAALLDETRLAQPALFVVEYALARVWMKWGVSPAAMIGHSIGEYVAACLAGVFSLEDALRLVTARGRLMQQMPRGAMLAVKLSPGELKPLMDERVSLAAVNAPASCVVAGEEEAIAGLEQQLHARGVSCRRLHTSHAFHSAMMQPALEPFAAEVRKVTLHAPEMPYISGLTGTWITEAQATDPNYWARHLREAVQFSAGIAELLREPESILLEVGPGQTLTALAKQQLESASQRIVLGSLRHPHDRQSDASFILETLGKLWLAGVKVDFHVFYADERRRRIPLPTYPFERQRYWIDPPAASATDESTSTSLNRKTEIDDWFYVPSWKRSVASEVQDAMPATGEHSCWVVFDEEAGVGTGIAGRLAESGVEVVLVREGAEFKQLESRIYEINPRRRADYERLLKELRGEGRTPEKFLHLWGVTPDVASAPSFETFDKSLVRGFDSLLLLSQSLGEYGTDAPLEIVVVTNNMQSLTGEEALEPEKATVLGLCKVIPLEYPNVTCRSVDIVLPGGSNSVQRLAGLAEKLMAEAAAGSGDAVVAYRGAHRWVQIFEPLPPVNRNNQNAQSSRPREKGVYILTGGLSEIDLALADRLAATPAGIVLTGDADVPPREKWEEWLAANGAADETSRVIERLRALEDAGAKLLVSPADVTNEEQMQSVVAEARRRFGRIEGVIHTASGMSGGIIQLKSLEAARTTLSRKLRGALVLRSVLQDEPPDFIALFSNTLSITGALGQSDYCAASAFLDAFAHAENAKGETRVVSINWRLPHWEGWDELPAVGNSAMRAEFAEVRADFGIGLAEGVEAFERIMASSQSQIIVSTQEFPALLERQKHLDQSARLEAREARHGKARTSIVADDGDAIAADELEQVVTGIWRELFGIERIGLTDNFFDLGGNSLLAIQLMAQLRKTFGLDLPLSNLFESPTVTGLATRIAESRLKEQEAAEIEQLLREIESLAPQDLQASLAQEVNSNGDAKR
jgi:acyl transferase domain-containing protein/acyl carrier protein